MLKDASLTARELGELTAFLRIPSISADPARAADVRAAADWLVFLIQARGGEAAIVEREGRPLVDALVRSGSPAPGRPPVLCYGHFDVQPPDPLELWESDPFSPEVRGGWLYARGVADDKGQIWALLRAALDLSRAGALPVDVRFVLTAKRRSAASIVDYVEETAGAARACVIFDTAMLDRDTPGPDAGDEGHVSISRRGANANSATSTPGVWRRRAERGSTFSRARVEQVIRARWASAIHSRPMSRHPERTGGRRVAGASAGAELLAHRARCRHGRDAAEEFHYAPEAPSLDVNGIEGGSPVQQRTIVGSSARANLSLRLAPGQTVNQLVPVIDELLKRELPSGAQLDVEVVASCDPGSTAPDSRAIELAAEAIERATGKRPLLLRSGGSLPLMPMLERLRIPAVVTGFDVPDGNIHAPNERMLVGHLGLAIAAARELYLAFAAL